MTNAEIIQATRNEIDKRYAEYREKMKSDDFTYYEGMADALDLFEQFIDTLESERPEPYNPIYDEAYLNEKIKKATESWRGVDVDAMLAECRGYDEEKSEKPMQEGLEEEIREYMSNEDNNPFDWDWRDKRDCARHFAKWGAEHTPLPEDTVLFNKGVAEGKRMMMEEAVEIGTTDIYWEQDGDRAFPAFDPPVEDLLMPDIISQRFNDGDKVRVIICKKED